MITIKRYRNRRLYHTGLKSFIVLSDLEQMIRRGEDFVVVDTATGRDITLSMLTAVISEGVHDWKDVAASREILRAVINLGGRKSMSILKNTVLAGIGFANLTRKKAEELIDAMIKSGELTKSEKKEAVLELLSKVEKSGKEASTKITKEAKEAGSRLSKEFEKTMQKIRPAKKTDIDSLSKKIDKLAKQMGELQKKLGE